MNAHGDQTVDVKLGDEKCVLAVMRSYVQSSCKPMKYRSSRSIDSSEKGR